MIWLHRGCQTNGSQCVLQFGTKPGTKLRINKLSAKRAELRPSSSLTVSSQLDKPPAEGLGPVGGSAPEWSQGSAGTGQARFWGTSGELRDKPRPPKAEQAETLYPDPVEQGRQPASTVLAGLKGKGEEWEGLTVGKGPASSTPWSKATGQQGGEWRGGSCRKTRKGLSFQELMGKGLFAFFSGWSSVGSRAKN